MKTRGTIAAATLVCLISSSATRAQAPSIEHGEVGCMVADRFPELTARVSPADAVSRARVYFRAAGTDDWYFVDMRRGGSDFRGTLPKPLASTKAIDYYLEVLDKKLQPERTAEFRPSVVGGAQECRKDVKLAAGVAAAKLIVGSLAGGAGLPAGFASTGLTLAGSAAAAGAGAGAAGAGAGGAAGGLSTGLVVGLVVAGAAGVGAAVAAGKGGEEDTGTSQPSPSPSAIPIVLAAEMGRIDVSQCAGATVSFNGGPLPLRTDGTFDETWSVVTPNTLRVQGRADTTSLQATLTCAARPGPTGSMSASGSNYTMSGSWSFGGQQGSLSVRRQQ